MKIVKEYLNEDEKVLKSRLLEFNKIKKHTPADLNIGVVQMIFDKTSGSWGDGKCAYSYDIYGSENWKEIIVWLINQGYTPHETEEVLRSKLMRWAGDDASKNENEKVNLDDFLKFNLQLFNGQTQVDYFLDEYNIRDSLKNLNYRLDLAKEQTGAADKRAASIQSVAEKIKSNSTTVVKIENGTKEKDK